MAQLTPEEEDIVFKLIDSGEEDESVLDVLENASREDIDFIIEGMRSSLANTPQVDSNTQEPTFNLDDPQELAMAISRRDNIPYDEALQTVMYAPRGSKARMQEGANQYFQPMSDLTDVWDLATTRLPQGITELYKEKMGQPSKSSMVEEMTRTQAPETKGFLNSTGEMAENISRDPIPFLSGGVSKIGNLIGYVPKVGSMVANAPKLIQGGLAGLGIGTGEVLAEQQRRGEVGDTPMSLGESALNIGASGILGGGVEGVKGALQSRKAFEEAPSILSKSNQGTNAFSSSPLKTEEKMLSDIMINTGFNKNQAKSLPIYSREIFANLDDAGKEQLTNYLSKGRIAASNSNELTPYDEVGKMFIKGEEAIDQARMQAGQKMGEIESTYLQDGIIETAPIKSKWEGLLDKYGSMSREVAEDGSVVYKNAPNKTKVGKQLRAEFEEADEIIQELEDGVTGERLRSLEMALADITPAHASTRSGKMNSKADAAINEMVAEMRDLVGEQIKKNGGEEAFNAYKQAKSDYGKYWKDQDFLQRRLGLKITDAQGEEIATRGGSMVKAMMNSAQDRNTKSLARVINELTGEDIGKNAAMAKFAMEVSGDTRAGLRGDNNISSLSKNGVIDATLGWLGDKTIRRGVTPNTFEGMTKLVEKVEPSGKKSILDLIPQNKYVESASNAVSNWAQPITRSANRSLLSLVNEEESNKVTEHKLGAQGQSKIDAGMRGVR